MASPLQEKASVHGIVGRTAFSYHSSAPIGQRLESVLLLDDQVTC